MSSYKWGYKSPNMGYKYIVTLLVTLLITTSKWGHKLFAGSRPDPESK